LRRRASVSLCLWAMPVRIDGFHPWIGTLSLNDDDLPFFEFSFLFYVPFPPLSCGFRRSCARFVPGEGRKGLARLSDHVRGSTKKQRPPQARALSFPDVGLFSLCVSSLVVEFLIVGLRGRPRKLPRFSPQQPPFTPAAFFLRILPRDPVVEAPF